MYAEAYARGQGRVVEFMDGRDADITVPATPEWSALDVLRHLTGVSFDVLHRNFDGFASDAWTEEHLVLRRHMSFGEVIVEWDDIIGPASLILDRVEILDLPSTIHSAAGVITPGVIPAMAISDLLHHEFDLRNAYGDTDGRDLLDIQFAAAGHVKSMRANFSASNTPTIRVEASDSGMGWDVGHEEPVATLTASSFELMRAIGGRRTRSEMAAMGWDNDPEPFLDHMTPPHLHVRETSLHE
jgi:hypothetical protein